MIVLPDSVNIVFSMRIQHIYTCVYDDKWESHSLASQNNLSKIDLRRKRDILLSPSWSLSNDNNPGNGRLLRVMCHVLFSDILLSIISIWVIGSFLLFLQINRQIGSCRRCKRTETIGILVTIICTSALLLQHLYYLLGVCVVTVACQYVHCSLIGKSTLDSESPKDNFFQVVLKMKINYWKGWVTSNRKINLIVAHLWVLHALTQSITRQ